VCPHQTILSSPQFQRRHTLSLLPRVPKSLNWTGGSFSHTSTTTTTRVEVLGSSPRHASRWHEFSDAKPGAERGCAPSRPLPALRARHKSSAAPASATPSPARYAHTSPSSPSPLTNATARVYSCTAPSSSLSLRVRLSLCCPLLSLYAFVSLCAQSDASLRRTKEGTPLRRR
jgi:hypothetical protein